MRYLERVKLLSSSPTIRRVRRLQLVFAGLMWVVVMVLVIHNEESQGWSPAARGFRWGGIPGFLAAAGAYFALCVGSVVGAVLLFSHFVMPLIITEKRFKTLTKTALDFKFELQH